MQQDFTSVSARTALLDPEVLEEKKPEPEGPSSALTPGSCPKQDFKSEAVKGLGFYSGSHWSRIMCCGASIFKPTLMGA